jgi:hypothetical protein
VTVEAVFRREYGRCVATLIRFLGDIDAAEEVVQDAFTVAAARWPSDGEPPSPGAWIVTTARNRAIDRLRRESVRGERHAQAHHLYGADTAGSAPPQEEGTVPDDRLRLVFTCCHLTRSLRTIAANSTGRRPHRSARIVKRRQGRPCSAPQLRVTACFAWERKWERVLLGQAPSRFVVLGPAACDLG